MARPPKLTESQREEVKRRYAAGETIRALAAEFGVGHQTIVRVSDRMPKIQNAAHQLVEAERMVEALPRADQFAVRSLADQLKATSQSLARAAVAGAATSAKLAEIAERRAALLSDTPSESDLRQLAQLAETGNRAADVALKLLMANKSRVDAAEDAAGLPTEIRIVHVGVDRGR